VKKPGERKFGFVVAISGEFVVEFEVGFGLVELGGEKETRYVDFDSDFGSNFVEDRSKASNV